MSNMGEFLDALDEVEREAKRFLERVYQARERIKTDSFARYGCKETAAVKRASMDLSRALTELRKARLI